MRPEVSITQRVDRLAGDPEAAQKLWEGYFRRLAGLLKVIRKLWEG